MPISRHARMTRTAISPRFAISRRWNIRVSETTKSTRGQTTKRTEGASVRRGSHSKDAEPRLRDRRVERSGEAQGQRLARPRRIQDAVIPQPRRGVVGGSFALVLLQDGRADVLLLFRRECLAVARHLVAL